MTKAPNKGLSPAAKRALYAIADRAADKAANSMATAVAARLAELETGQTELYELVATRRNGRTAAAPVRDELRPRVLAALTAALQDAATIEQAVGRPVKDRSVRRVLVELAQAGVAERTDDGRWRLASADGCCPACRRPCNGSAP